MVLTKDNLNPEGCSKKSNGTGSFANGTHSQQCNYYQCFTLNKAFKSQAWNRYLKCVENTCFLFVFEGLEDIWRDLNGHLAACLLVD